MAMTKKEQQRLADLEQQLREAKAFRFTEPVEPDVGVPETFAEGLRKGFLFNDHNDDVSKACSSSCYHSYGSHERTSTQGSRRLYSTELLALRALRNQVELKCAKRLSEIDRRIASAASGEASE
jgi:hypothetical protein